MPSHPMVFLVVPSGTFAVKDSGIYNVSVFDSYPEIITNLAQRMDLQPASVIDLHSLFKANGGKKLFCQAKG